MGYCARLVIPRNGTRKLMTPDRWQQVKQIVADALERTQVRRASYVETVCADDADLRGQVDRLLAAHENAGSQFLDSPASQEQPPEKLSCDRWLGRTVGHYQIVEEIGSGGMGDVFRATRTDDQYAKEVAVKLVRTDPGADFLRSRFRTL